jgi:hypothetical protein
MDMRSLLYFAFVAYIAACVAPVMADQPVQPTRANATAYQQGQANVRLWQDVKLTAGACGIVLLRARCLEDLRAQIAAQGPDPSDNAIAKWFTTGDDALRVTSWQNSFIPDKTWTENPTFAWWYTAGIASIAASFPQDDSAAQYAGLISDVFAGEVAVSPGGSNAWIPVGDTPYTRLASIQTKLEQIFTVEPYPQSQSASGLNGYAQLGVYFGTLEQLVDNPYALSRPESRAFAKVVLMRLQQAHTDFSDGLSAQPLLAAIDLPFLADPAWLDKTLRRPLSNQLNTKWPKEQRFAFVAASLIAQVAYNAAVLKDSTQDATFRKAISVTGAWPSASAKLRTDVSTLVKIPSTAHGGTWAAINAAASAATLDIANGT